MLRLALTDGLLLFVTCWRMVKQLKALCQAVVGQRTCQKGGSGGESSFDAVSQEIGGEEGGVPQKKL